jgi:hypothetical protein
MVVDVAPAGRLAGVVDYNIFPDCNKAKRFAKKCGYRPYVLHGMKNRLTSANGHRGRVTVATLCRHSRAITEEAGDDG